MFISRFFLKLIFMTAGREYRNHNGKYVIMNKGDFMHVRAKPDFAYFAQHRAHC